MREIYGRILMGLLLGTIASICFLNTYLTAAMISGNPLLHLVAILIISLIEYQQLIAASLLRFSGKDGHKTEHAYAKTVQSNLLIAIQLLLPIASALFSLSNLFLVNMVCAGARVGDSSGVHIY
eukprot:TRINITY_DN11917_c0_g1_i3.p2 TRINITY_DN11917_c0_g1~~TRINITY_DN11917_c0_g1_i3.p2  ORF type:complete len:124 (-),score=16.21 TRINITY_DN11917_c0_g1_i3:222-593(-)